jgi:hypothetical protein
MDSISHHFATLANSWLTLSIPIYMHTLTTYITADLGLPVSFTYHLLLFFCSVVNTIIVFSREGGNNLSKRWNEIALQYLKIVQQQQLAHYDVKNRKRSRQAPSHAL